MLVLSRKPGEHLTIGNDITVTVVSIRGDQVRIGIEAPRDVPVLRAELLDVCIPCGQQRRQCTCELGGGS